ncbi:MAG TPA: cysteine peptidase family C39 domain-containing protein [Terriglobales bacterium]|nr:cysteine peptidase family C39 domain-containing protein [Terriglobales bacterium]
MVSSATAATANQQPDPSRTRSCGAVCLSTVYAALGQEADPAEIWEKIAKKNNLGSIASTTHLMGKDALERGLSAVVMQARDPIYVLRACQNAKIQTILNHRLAPSSPQGHFTILAGIDAQKVTLNDPFYKRSHNLIYSEFLQLWQPRPGDSEIAGFVLIGIAEKPIPAQSCQLCRTPFIAEAPCPRCQQPIPLGLTPLLGCLKIDCAARLWSAICCPSCDFMWQSSAEQPVAGALGSPTASFAVQPAPLPQPTADDPWNLSAAFAAIDKFKADLLAIPALAKNVDIHHQMQMVEEQKQKLREMQTEYIAEAKAHKERLANVDAEAEQRLQAYLQQLEKLNGAGSPPNAEELGRALLKNLGLSR